MKQRWATFSAVILAGVMHLAAATELSTPPLPEYGLPNLDAYEQKAAEFMRAAAARDIEAMLRLTHPVLRGNNDRRRLTP